MECIPLAQTEVKMLVLVNKVMKLRGPLKIWHFNNNYCYNIVINVSHQIYYMFVVQRHHNTVLEMYERNGSIFPIHIPTV